MKIGDIEKKLVTIFDNELTKQPRYEYKKIFGLKGRVINNSHQPLIITNYGDYQYINENVELLLKLYSRLPKGGMEEKFFFEFLFSAFEKPAYKLVSYLTLQTSIRLNKINEVIVKLFDTFIDSRSSKGLYNCFRSLSDGLRYENYLYGDQILEYVKGQISFVLTKSSKYTVRPTISFEPITPDNFLDLIKEILEQIKMVLYLRLQKELSEIDVIEINQDKVKVQQLINKYKFNRDLQECLNRFEKEYLKANDEFDFKNCIGHIRSFIESLGKEIMKRVQANNPVKFSGNIEKAEQVRDYLRKIKFITKKENDLYRALYGLMSDEGVHPIKANKETARICRNMAIEYSLILLERVDS